MGMKRVCTALFLVLSNFLTGCGGIANLPGATSYFEPDAAASTDLTNDCHFLKFKESVAVQIQSNCVSCHANPGNGSLIFSTGVTTEAMAVNFNKTIAFIEKGTTDASMTPLLQRITSGSNYNHPFKQALGTTVINSFYDFADQYLNDPECSNNGNGGDPSGGFF